MKITRRWLKKAEIYKIFTNPWKHRCTFTEKDAEELFIYESTGMGNISIDTFNDSSNGFAVGKKWADVQVNMWLEDFSKNRLFARMCLQEMYWNKEFPEWWLDTIFMIPEFENMVLDIKANKEK